VTWQPRPVARTVRAPLPRSYRHLVAASGSSNLADGMFQIALPLVALGITRDPAAFASVTLVGRLPWLLFALPAGALADRLDRRRTMLLVSIARTLLIGLLGVVVAQGWEELWILYIVAFALGMGETLFDTAAQSVMPGIVDDPDGLARANGRLYAVELTANQFVGPPLGGLLASLALATALFASSGAYLLAVVALVAMSGRFRPERTGPATKIRTDIKEGLRYLVGHRVLRSLAICVGISNLVFTAQFAVFPLFVIDPGPMGLGAAGFGLLLTAMAIGSLAATPLVEWFERRFGRRRSLLISLLLFPIGPAVPAVTASVPANVAASLVVGFVLVLWNVITVSYRQRVVPDGLLGRVNAGYRLLAWGTMPLGAALGGVLAATIGLQGTFAVCAAGGLLCLPIAARGVGPTDLDDTPATTAATADVDAPA
jgi:MFS family permease